MNKINTPKGKIPTRVTYEPSIWLYTLSLGWNRVRTANKSRPELCLVGLFSAVVQVKRVWSFSRCTAGLSKRVNVSALSGAGILTRGKDIQIWRVWRQERTLYGQAAMGGTGVQDFYKYACADAYICVYVYSDGCVCICVKAYICFLVLNRRGNKQTWSSGFSLIQLPTKKS